MKITVAKSAGFCFGVKNAVDTAYNHAGEDVCVLGELIHNPLVIEKLESFGVKCVKSPSDVKTSKVIIRSHGAPKAVFDYFEKEGISVIDATCPFVKKIHKIVNENYAKGKQIIILGEANHSEVIGINGWCENSAIIFDDISKVPELEENKEYALVAQTTFPVEKYRKIIEILTKHRLKTVEFFDTICYTTKERQEEAISLAKSSTAVIILGGKKSSNTLKLYEICKKYCDRVFFIEKIADLQSVKINKTDSLAIMAGASTPTELIEEVTNIMSQTENLDKIEQVAEVVAPEAAEKKESMKDLFESSNSGKFVSYRAGKRLKAHVISVNENGVYCSIGGKKDGFIAKEDATMDGNYNPEDFKVGDEIEVMIIENKSKDSDYIALSKKEIDSIIEGDKKVAEIISGGEFSLVCDKVAKNKADKAVGLLGKLGSYTIFVPASQIRSGFVKNLEEYTTKPLRLRALADKEIEEGAEVEAKRPSKRIVASQRVILEEEKAAREEAFWAEMQVGAVVVGKVKRFTEFGAFVSVKGFDCLARKSEISWTRIEKPEDVLELNEKYEFIILDVDREKGRISLGYKQLQKTPYEIANEQLTIGDVIKGKVVRIAPFGAFVEIIPGVDGLVHISQVTHDYIKTLDDVLKVGDEVEAKIIKIDDKKITLSIKELLPEPEVTAEVAEGEEVKEDKPARKPRERKAPKTDDAQGEKKTVRKVKKEDDGQPHEWVDQSAATTTLGDLFAGINFDFNESEDK